MKGKMADAILNFTSFKEIGYLRLDQHQDDLDPQNSNLYYYHDFYLVFHFFPLPDPVDLTGLLDLSLRGGEVGITMKTSCFVTMVKVILH
jgi:hypothetical protein